MAAIGLFWIAIALMVWVLAAMYTPGQVFLGGCAGSISLASI